MPILNQTELIAALEKRDFDLIIGTPESRWLDFKQKQYDSEPGKVRKLSRKGKYELCKDVAALANDEGGVILIGVAEQKNQITGESLAHKLTPIKPSNLDVAHYQQMITHWVYPLVEGLQLTWYLTSDKPGTDEGYLAIIVPKRKGGLHIVKDALDDNSPLTGLTIPKRYNDQTYIYTAEALYELIQKPGSGSGTAKDQFKKSDATNDSVTGRTPKQILKDSQEIRDNLIASLDWNELPVLTVQIVPKAGAERLDDFYGEIETLFRDTKPLRGMGFNLNSFGYEATTVDGAYVKSGVRDAALRLDPDGTLTMAIRGNENLLGWGVNREQLDNHAIKINAIVLVEEVFELVRFTSETLSKKGLKDWLFIIDIRRFKEYKLQLYKGGPNSLFGFDLKPASSDNWVKIVNRSGEYEADVYKILEEIYALFTLPATAIPYSTDNKISENNIIALNNNANGF